MNRRWLVFLLALVTVLLAALSTGSMFYYVIGATMAVMMVLSFLSALVTLYSAQIGFQMPTVTVRRTESLPMQISVRHRCPLPVAALYLTLSLPEDSSTVDELVISPRPFFTTSLRYMLKCPHRGVYQVGVDTLWVSDVFGLFTLRRVINDRSIVLTVQPNVADIAALDLASGENGPESLAHNTDDMSSPSSVRAYVEGDSLKKVHWKLTMRKRELIVRQYEEAARPDTLIIMDCGTISATREMALDVEDAMCEVAAAVALSQLKEGFPVRMPLSSAQPLEVSGQSLADFGRFLTALTEVKFDGENPFESVLELETRRLMRSGGAVIITQRLNTQISDMALRMKRNGLKVRLYWISDSQRQEALTMLMRLATMGVYVKRVSPLCDWKERNLAS
ncbi:MAG TPA: DUF58 domain-containing protein [Candidatus Fimadaptatus faecigallinarum]|uniref:DUF58 domain-containing protein n=1 Tax=Candidatus Fimadaptatus faecigallinarum TaxID=2840814 RepID=A0A9D1LRS0_9FIRM|nr:DUF58 domain-containing protein [Candidatus Fimadaptatus faecigallinarum]